MMAIAFQQLREATKQRSLASEAREEAVSARNSASEANKKAIVAQAEAEQARDETRNTVEHLRANIKLMLEMEHLTPTITMIFDSSRVEKVRQKLEEFAVPDEKERKEWLESLK